ncbi:MAG: hypothetical protein JO250_11075 [Armatimonadetes bacterium]|nr:hypothetical protein [Armatimonadota bacterium]
MDIFLQDLGLRRQTALLHWRAVTLNAQTGRGAGGVGLMPAPSLNPAAPPRLRGLGHLWARGAGCPPETAAIALTLLRSQTYGVIGGLVGGSLGFWMPGMGMALAGPPEAAVGALGMFGCGALMSGFGLWIPGHWLRRICRPPLTAAEVEALGAAATDDLERAFLRLAADAVRQPTPPEAAERVRAALRALGETLDRQPAVAVPRVGAEALRAEAARALDDARQEPDPVVAESHVRRAEALGRSADAAERSQTLMRRAAALRDEMGAQIESLRLGLAGFQTASGDVAGLASLADAVREVATESVSVAAARAELDAALTEPPPVLRLRAGA